MASAWAKALEQHPDRDFVEFVLNGIVQGFRIGFDYHTHKCRPAKQNMIPAKKNPLIVEEYLFKEREAGRVVGPLPRESMSSAQISPFGVIPKPHQPGKWRLILDLSSPEGASVNDGICKGLCSLRCQLTTLPQQSCHWVREPCWQRWIFSQLIGWYPSTLMITIS